MKPMSSGSDAKDAPPSSLELNHENMPTNRAYQDDHAEVCLVVMTNFLNCEEKKIKLRRKVGIFLEYILLMFCDSLTHNWSKCNFI